MDDHRSDPESSAEAGAPAAPPRATARRVRLRRLLKRAGRAVEYLILVLVLVAGAVALRLAAGPVALDAVAPWVTGLVERSGPFRVAFREPALAWSQAQDTLLLQVRDLEVRTRDGGLVAAAPEVAVRVDVPSLLLRGQLRAREVEVRLPQLELARLTDRSLVLGFGGHLGSLPLGEATGGGMLGRLAGGAGEANDPRLRALRRIRVEAEGLAFRDEPSGRQIASGRAGVRLTRNRGEGWELRLDVGAVGGAPDARFLLEATPAATTAGRQDVRASLTGLPLAALDGLVPGASLAGATLPVSLTARLGLDTAGLAPGPGSFRVSTPGGTLALPGVLAGPLELGESVVAGTAGDGWRSLSLTRGDLRLAGGASARVTGNLERGQGRAGTLALDVAAEKVDARTVESLWPLGAGPKARQWVVQNVDGGGQVPSASLRLTLPEAPPGAAAPPDPAYALDFAFADAGARFLDEWPAARGLKGKARLDRERFVLDLEAGRIGDVQARGGNLTFTELRTAKPTHLALSLDVAGPLPAAVDLLARKPVRLAEALGIDPRQATGGRGQASVAVSLPLHADTKPGEVTKQVTATLTDAAIKGIRPGYDLSDGDLAVKVGDAAADVTGTVAANGVPVRLNWHERLEGRGERRRVEATGALDRAGAVALGAAAAWPDGVTGAIPFTAVVTDADRKPRHYDVAGDLAPLRVDLARLGLVKAPGEAGRLRVVADQPDQHRLSITEATAAFGEASVKAGAELALDPTSWRSIDLRAVQTLAGTLTGGLAKGEGEVVRATVKADRLDLRPYLTSPAPAAPADKGAATSGGGPAFGDEIDLDLDARSVALGPDPLQAVTLTASRRAGRLTTARGTALLPGPGTNRVNVDVKAAALPGTFSADADDMGALLGALDVRQSRIEGGRARASGTVQARGPATVWEGEARLREFTVRDAPFVARVLRLASLQGLGDALSGREGLAIDRATGGFSWDGTRVELRQARAAGSGIGARVDGTIDTAARTLALSGTVAPVYGLNRLVGQIPIVGNLLRGERSDAAIAATFSVGGRFDDPQLQVNPLSALVPGFLRDLLGDLFEGAQRVEEPPERN